MTIASLAIGLRFAVGLVFLASGAAKLRAPRAFAAGVAGYRLVPGRLAGATAAAVVAAELGTAGSLLSGAAPLAGAVAALGLGLVFATAVGVNLRRRARIPCHCFGTGEQISRRTLVRAGALAAGAALIVIADLAGVNISAAGRPTATVLQLTLGVGYVLLAAWAFAISEPESRPS